MSDAKVLFDYEAEADDELSLKEGEIIKNIEKKEDGWWEGELYGKRGMFPENFVEEIKKQAPFAAREVQEEKPVAASEKTRLAKVTFDYDAENDDELSLKEGDMVKIINQEEDGWWKGELNGKIGVFPTNFVEEVKDPIPNTQPTSDSPQQESVEEKGPGKKTPKALGGIGFGGLLTQDALSGIKLRKSNSNTNISAKKDKPDEPTELSKKLSNKRNPPEIPRPIRPTKLSKVKEKASAEFDYEGEQSDELTLRKGDIINILEKDASEGWWKGELNGKIGLFPDNFVKLLPHEGSQKETNTAKDKAPTDMPLRNPQVTNNDVIDGKPGRPELPFPKLKSTTDRKPLLPVPPGKPAEEVTHKYEPPLESKPGQDEKAPKLLDKPPVKKSPPLLPKKPDKPKPPVDKPPSTKEPSIKPQVELRHRNGPPVDPSKRFSEMPRSEVSHETQPKRHSSGSDIPLNLNDIKSTSVLQPLTTDRPKNPAKSPPTRYGRPHSPKKGDTPEKMNDTEWPRETKEVTKPVEKPKKPSIPESSKPAIPESSKPAIPESSKPKEPTVNTGAIKKLQDEINTVKNSLELITKEFKEYIQKSEKRFRGMEKKLADEIDDITREVDEEKKARSGLDVEVNRLRKLIKNQSSS